MSDSEAIAKEINDKTPAERLRLAADLLELKNPNAFGIARSIVHKVDAEMTVIVIGAEIAARKAHTPVHGTDPIAAALTDAARERMSK